MLVGLAVEGRAERRLSLDDMSMIGVLLLMGIVAKNAILLIDFAKWRTESGMPLRDALIGKVMRRFRRDGKLPAETVAES
jgi:multidrug efflux pump subunit AcrB